MPSFTLSSEILKMASLVTLQASFTPSSFRRGAFLMLTSSSSLSLMPSCVLQSKLTVSCLLSFLLTILSCLSLSRSLWFMAPVEIKIDSHHGEWHVHQRISQALQRAHHHY